MLPSLGSFQYGVLLLVLRLHRQLVYGVLKLCLVSYCDLMVLLVMREWCFLGLALAPWVLIVLLYTSLDRPV